MDFDFNEIIGLVDGFLTLAVLIYFIFKQNKREESLMLENAALHEARVQDLKTQESEYVQLLEGTLKALKDNQDFLREYYTGTEHRIVDKIESSSADIKAAMHQEMENGVGKIKAAIRHK